MGKYKFRLPNGEVTEVEAKDFVAGLMKVCDQVGIQPVSASERGVKMERVTKLIKSTQAKEKET